MMAIRPESSVHPLATGSILEPGPSCAIYPVSFSLVFSAQLDGFQFTNAANLHGILHTAARTACSGAQPPPPDTTNGTGIFIRPLFNHPN